MGSYSRCPIIQPFQGHTQAIIRFHYPTVDTSFIDKTIRML